MEEQTSSEVEAGKRAVNSISDESAEKMAEEISNLVSVQISKELALDIAKICAYYWGTKES